MTSTTSYTNGMPPELNQTLGDRLKKSLRHSGLSVAQMAEYLEVHRNTISGWLADRSKPMSVFLRLWADKTQLPIEWIRDGQWPDNTPVKPIKPAPTAAARKAPARKAQARKAPARTSPAKRSQPAKTARRRTAG